MKDKANKTNETYVPLSRGLLKHLPKIPGNALKIYVYLLLKANFTGKDKGKLAQSVTSMAGYLNINKRVVLKALKSLKPRYIDYKLGKNQYQTTVFLVKKYKTVGDFAGVKSAPTLAKNAPTLYQKCTGTFHKPNKHKRKQKRNKYNNYNKEKKPIFSKKAKELNHLFATAVTKKKREIGL